MNYTNPFRRSLFQRDICAKIKRRLAVYQRRLARGELSDLARILRPERPKTILDVGANVGRFTWQCHKLFKEATVYALEPDPTAFRTLQAIHGGTPRVRVFSVAAADKDGDLDFIQRPVSYNSSFLNVAPGADGSTDTTIKVRACTLDRFCAEQSITHIDLLKVDTEGADLLVLQGAKGMLAQGCVDVIMTEVLFVPLYERQATVDEIAAFLASHGFRVFNLYVEHETRYGQAIYGNAIFLGRRLQQKLGRGW